MSMPYERTGRTRQKVRTRDELVSAARGLIGRGNSAPTVEDAAAAASVSRTTAYRYFPNQTALLVAAHPETELSSLLPPGIGDDPEARLLAAVDAFTRLILETEQQQRTMLRLSLEPDAGSRELPLRKGRAIAWFEDALSPLVPRLSETVVHRLAVAVRSTVGIESLVWLTDVACLSREEAAVLMRGSARALLAQAMAG
ncbi:AcrR family transcriptional regulator [Cryobacterium sp. MP_M5]|uniref:TetR/AcrR family transcriptional regulator n=1 Tax=unclassified Cryobacterium TaxID=2649013 RepID=UPI0018CB63BF|nr:MULTISPECIES: TetR/AcrR family transcriptional regulator [unclassified Cryobacterium]MBG6059317.1 AcrR family transcriptional regulator [Cryobacterium sp. MP_M3]MEC5177835.1 AcrR family transcriptional regulator [Cryobacterium sp. MP_M5]